MQSLRDSVMVGVAHATEEGIPMPDTQRAGPVKVQQHIRQAISLHGLRDQIQRVDGVNAKIAVFLTNIVGSMWCAYAFAVLAVFGLPAALKPGGEGIIAWIAQTFLQLVLLSVIMVGQNVQTRRATCDRRAPTQILCRYSIDSTSTPKVGSKISPIGSMI